MERNSYKNRRKRKNKTKESQSIEQESRRDIW
jgi:hypothetical protein